MKVLIADDHALVRQGIIQLLSKPFKPVTFGEAENAAEAMKLVRRERWDVLLLDISMPGRSGLDIVKDIRAEKPGLPILVLSMYPEDQFAFRALRGGASGYVTKNAPPSELVQAIRKVVSGRKYVSVALAEQMADSFGPDFGKRPHERLSDREYEVLRMIGSGKAVSEIAKHLSLSVKTVSTHRSHILKKMGMKNNAELTHYVIENRLGG